MVWCNHCVKNVPGIRPYDGALACNLCGRILENFNYSTEVTFVKNAAGQSQASGNIVRSIQSQISSSRERRMRIARDEFMNLRDALGIGDERDDPIDMAVQFFSMAVEQGFTKGRRSELVHASCLYLTCRELGFAYLLIDFSSYLRVSVYELGSVYLQLCELLYIVQNKNYEKLVDPSIFIPRFSYSLLKGKNDKVLVRKTRDIIANMKRDWLQTGRKPSGICGAALYTAALSHGIKCSKTDIVKIVHICEATLTKRLIEFGNTEAASLNVDELTEREEALHKMSFTRKPNSEKKGVLCEHQDCEPLDCGLCESCYKEFIIISGGRVGGSDPPAFQRAEKERMEKASREENDEQLNSERDPDYSSVSKREKDEDDGHSEASDESGNLSDVDDGEIDSCFRNEDEMREAEKVFDLLNPEYNEKEAAKKAAAKEAALNASNAANCPERDLVEASRAAVAKSRKEKREKRAEELKNAPPPATTMDAVSRMLERKRIDRLFNYGLLEEVFDTSVEKSPKRSKTETEMEKTKKKEVMSKKHENDENEEEDDEGDEEDEEGYAAPYEMNTGEKFYEDDVEEEEDGYDFGLY